MNLTLSQLFFDVNRGLCETYSLNPLELLYYPSEDVFDLINGTIDYNDRQDKKSNNSGKIRREAGDNWF